jgi:transketolase
VEARLAVLALAEREGPAYLRLGKGGEATVHVDVPEFRLGQAIPIRDGADVMLLVTGALLGEAIKAADLLAEQGVHAGVISMPTIKPLDDKAVLRAAARTRWLVTIEEHSTTGGLGSAVAEVLAEAEPGGARLLRCGVTTGPYTVGGHAYLRRFNGLDATSMAQRVAAVATTASVR